MMRKKINLFFVFLVTASIAMSQNTSETTLNLVKLLYQDKITPSFKFIDKIDSASEDDFVKKKECRISTIQQFSTTVSKHL